MQGAVALRAPIAAILLSRITAALQRPQVELIAGAVVLAMLGLALAWKAFEARGERAVESIPTAAVPFDEPPAVDVAAAPRRSSQELTPLAERFRSLSDLRARERG